MLRPRLARARIPQLFRRSRHSLPDLYWLTPEKGIPTFLQSGLHIAWHQYQSWLLANLDKWSDDGASNTKQLLIKFARNPDTAAAFNYASMAHNNEFFFKGLTNEPNKPDPTKPDPDESTRPQYMSPLLHKKLVKDFSSLPTLRETLLSTASSMFGPGFVWLVMKSPEATQSFVTSGSNFGILTTYLAGSPYPGAHFRRQESDLNTVGVIGSKSRGDKGVPGYGGFSQASLYPVLCVNTWEHVWLPDYGMFGKEDYLRRWWDHINWTVVENRCNFLMRDPVR